MPPPAAPLDVAWMIVAAALVLLAQPKFCGTWAAEEVTEADG